MAFVSSIFVIPFSVVSDVVFELVTVVSSVVLVVIVVVVVDDDV